jgi:polyhydroxybutyrate depolymerase
MKDVSHVRSRAWLATLGALTLLASLLAAPVSADEHEVTITGVTPVAPITVPNGTALEDAIAALPPTTTITVSEGDPIVVDLDWQLRPTVELSRGGVIEQEWFPTARGAYEMLGTFELPDGVVQADPEVPLQVVATVNIAGGALLTIEDTHVLSQPGTYVSDSLTFAVGGERTFHYYVPTSYVPGEPIPVMITLHGAGSYGLGQMAYSEFDRVAEENGFIVVAPDYGLSALGLFLVPGIAGFTDAILDHLAEQYTIDERRIYASGISMGGSSSQTLAYELPDRIAAIAPVAIGITRLRDQPLPRPMTVVSFYGTWDSSWGPGFMQATEHVAAQLGASSEPEVTTWPATADDHTSVNRYAFTGGVYGTEAVFYEVVQGGHTWPGTYQYASLITVGPTTQHIHATDLIWEHLSRASLPIAVDVTVQSGGINPRSNGVVPVAVLSTDGFDATTIDLDTVRFGPAGAAPVGASVTDIDDDGTPDLLLRFRIPDTGIEAGTETVTLTGLAAEGGAFHQEVEVRTVPGR